MRNPLFVLIALALPFAAAAGPSDAVETPTPTPEATPAVMTVAEAKALLAEGRARGERDAEQLPTSHYSKVGFAAGCLLGPCGFFGSHVYANSKPEIPGLEPGRPLEYLEGYEAGYRETLQARRRRAAAIWGTVGMTVLTSALIAFTNCDYSESCSERTGL